MLVKKDNSLICYACNYEYILPVTLSSFCLSGVWPCGVIKKNTDATGSYMIWYNLAKFGTLMKIPLYEDSWSVKIDYPYCIVYSITFFENCYRLSTWIWNLWLCTKFVNSHFKNARITGTRARKTRNARQQEAGTRNQEHAICAFYDACVKLRLWLGFSPVLYCICRPCAVHESACTEFTPH